MPQSVLAWVQTLKVANWQGQNLQLLPASWATPLCWQAARQLSYARATAKQHLSQGREGAIGTPGSRQCSSQEC